MNYSKSALDIKNANFNLLRDVCGRQTGSENRAQRSGNRVDPVGDLEVSTSCRSTESACIMQAVCTGIHCYTVQER